VSPARPATRPVVAFGTLSLSYFACIGLYNPYVPLWLQSLGFGTLAIGTISSLQAWTRVVTPYAWSWSADRWGQRVLLLRLAAAGSLACAIALWGTRSFTAVAVVTTLLFVFNSGIVPLSEAALARHLVSADGMDAGRYGRVRMWGSIGFIVAVLAGGAIMERAGIAVFPVAVALLYAGLLAATWQLPLAREEGHHDEAPTAVWPRLREPEVAWFFASIFFTVLAHTGAYAFLSLYLDALGYGKTAVGLMWALAVLAEIGFFWTQGHWFARLSPVAWLKLAALMAALRFALTAAAAQWVLALMLAQAAHAVTFAAHHGACTATLHRLFPGRLRGRGQALYSALGYGISGVLGGVGGGWLIARHGYPAVFWASAAAALAGLACVWQMTRVRPAAAASPGTT
jgi:MFS transporter, PPP family, 3-phenylpropionic acid transporter